ncbi:Zinc/iron permease [Rhizoclosmatium globosum]|uniref:Zinc/iron permease n=1 Tax=Rhizoclosmatium globosum TaxID=329046 RepID=A0A1Y2D2X9_9FUNG|nr:Zinc/iron permease [Rhizoclosmatium globosum]|eukprot:ORY53648.1 Zinc/iron permease [Rhizoclosmatium globosum]
MLIAGTGIFTTLALGVHAHVPFFASVLQMAKMFGIGIIASTAWFHLLPDAFESFTNPCLPEAWKGFGVGYVGLFGMIAAFLVQYIELAAVDYKSQHEDNDEEDVDLDDETSSVTQEGVMGGAGVGTQSDCDCTDLDRVVVSGNSAAFLSNERTALLRAVQETAASDLNYNTMANRAGSSSSDPGIHVVTQRNKNVGEYTHQRDSELGIMILEAGIIFHSVVIGITLGVTPDDAFMSLLCAACFHQMFEGLALGVLIGNLSISESAKRLMCLVYPLTTPIGILVGIYIRSFYNENDGGLIVAQGIFNSLSAGILFYNTYTELMSAEINHSGHFHGFSPRFKTACFFAMYLGAGMMALLAVWA